MDYKNISSILNTEILQNALGLATTVNENLSNIVEVGTAISNLSADALKDFQKKLVVGVYNYVINREYKSNNFDVLRNAVEYGGGLQRIMASGRFSIKDSHLLNLVNGTSYLDGKFYGLDVDSKVYTDTKAFKVVHSMSQDDFAQKFMNAEDTLEFMGLIATTEINTIRVAVAELEKRIIVMATVEALKDNRKVQLVTEFNKKLGLTDSDVLTYDDIVSDRQKFAYFNDFVKECVNRVKVAMLEVNKRYNDGTVETFSRPNDIKTVLVSEFAQDVKYMSDPIDFNAPQFSGYKEIVAWQNPNTTMLPKFSSCTHIGIYETSDPTHPTNYENVVGVVYDMYSVGATVKADKVTIEEVGTEGFRNLHHHLAINYYVDTRLGAVAFTLD